MTNPYEPSFSESRDINPRWGPKLWDLFLLGLGLFFVGVTSIQVLRIYYQFVEHPLPENRTWAAAELRLIATQVTAVLFVLFTLSRFFWRPRSKRWRIVIAIIAILLSFNSRSWLPSIEGLLLASFFALAVLPVIRHGYGWTGAALRFRERKRQRAT